MIKILKYKINRFIKAFKVSRWWVKALESTADEDYVTARKILDRVIENYAKDSEYRLLSGLVNFKLKAFQEALSDVSRATDLLENSTRYTREEKNYLYCYADKIISEIVKISPEYASSLEFRGDFTNLDKSKVREGIRLNFPLEIKKQIVSS